MGKGKEMLFDFQKWDLLQFLAFSLVTQIVHVGNLGGEGALGKEFKEKTIFRTAEVGLMHVSKVD